MSGLQQRRFELDGSLWIRYGASVRGTASNPEEHEGCFPDRDDPKCPEQTFARSDQRSFRTKRCGEVPEWSNGSVSKTDESLVGSGGSNPSLSATSFPSIGSRDNHSERCQSGRMSTLGKRVGGKLPRGFKSLPLRQTNAAPAAIQQSWAALGRVREATADCEPGQTLTGAAINRPRRARRVALRVAHVFS